MMTTTMAQLFDAAQTPDGKILNALELPMSLACLDSPPKFSMDLLALPHTSDPAGVGSDCRCT